MPSLPLKVNVGVRDSWDATDSAVQKAFASLNGVLGHEIVCSPEWSLLLASLGAAYADKAAFVPAIAGTAACWARALTELLENEPAGASGDDHEAWTDELLERVKGSYSQLRLFLEPGPPNNDLASTRWDGSRGGFAIALPATSRIDNPLAFFATFKDQLLRAWKDESEDTSAPLATRPGGAGVAVGGPADDWADIEESIAQLTPVTTTTAAMATFSRRPVVEIMPDFGTMPRPDELLQKPPYHLFVYGKGNKDMEVQCSHTPTLQFLAEYLKKWCRVNHQCSTRPASVRINLQECAFGLGAMYDSLTMFAEKKYGGGQYISPTIILALVEGVLGYEQTFTDGSTWIYRRDAPFKNL